MQEIMYEIITETSLFNTYSGGVRGLKHANVFLNIELLPSAIHIYEFIAFSHEENDIGPENLIANEPLLGLKVGFDHFKNLLQNFKNLSFIFVNLMCTL